MEPGYLTRVEVTNRSDLVERLEQMIQMLEQVNEQESKFKHQKRLKTTAWSARVKSKHI